MNKSNGSLKFGILILWDSRLLWPRGKQIESFAVVKYGGNV